MPEVCELPWLVVDELQVRRGLCGAWPGALKLSASMPEVCELPWLVVEWRDRRLWWDVLPALLPLARERLSRWSMSSSRASLMYDSRYCFFSEVGKERKKKQVVFKYLPQTDFCSKCYIHLRKQIYVLQATKKQEASALFWLIFLKKYLIKGCLLLIE